MFSYVVMNVKFLIVNLMHFMPEVKMRLELL